MKVGHWEEEGLTGRTSSDLLASNGVDPWKGGEDYSRRLEGAREAER